jgi:hypothetical protein
VAAVSFPLAHVMGFPLEEFVLPLLPAVSVWGWALRSTWSRRPKRDHRRRDRM